MSPASSALPKPFIVSSLLAEQRLERGARRVGFAGRRDIRAHLGLEMVAEVRPGLVAYLFGRGLAAVLGDARVVLHTHAACVQLRTAGLAFLEAPQRQRQRFQR